MSRESFQAFLEKFGLPQEVFDKLWNGNVRSIKELACSETSTIRELIEHPVLSTILPILQQHSGDISTAEDPYSQALNLLHCHADDEEPLVDDTQSTSSFGETASTEQTIPSLNNKQSLYTEKNRKTSEADSRLGRLHDEEGDYMRGDSIQHGNKVHVDISGGKLYQPNIGGTTVYNKENIVINSPQHAEIHLHFPQEKQTKSKVLSDGIEVAPKSSDFNIKKSEDQSSKSIEKLRAAIRDLNRPNLDVDLSKFSISPDRLPQVYPEIYLVDFYGGNVIPDDEEYHPKSNTIELTQSDEKVTFNKFVENFKIQNFISLIGYPGSGKTTFSKRLARELSAVDDFVVFRYLFLNMSNDENEKFTLKQFLLGDVNLMLNEGEKNCAFDWIINHPDKIFFIFDGFDQVNWTIHADLKLNPQYDDSLSPKDLVSKLCQGKFLKNCHIIFTSRPHAMLNIPNRCRPKQTYFLRDLTSEDMQKLFYALVNNQQKSDELWEALKTKAPQLQSICHNPLMLHLYVRASLVSSRNIEHITTMTKLFQTVLLNLKTSDHAVFLTDTVVVHLAKIAYETTEKGTVLITTDDLEKEGLTTEQVQDVVVNLWGADQNCELLEGHHRLYFTHQTFQEYFAAFYISHKMSLQKFKTFLHDHMLSEHWSVVVNFLSGILLDQDKRKVERSEQRTELRLRDKRKKKIVFLETLKKAAVKVARTKLKDIEALDTLSISKILRESDNIEVIRATASSFVDGWLDVSNIALSESDVHAVACVIRAVPGRMRYLGLSNCNIDSNKLSILAKNIREMSDSIAVLGISNNHLTCIDEVKAILHKVEKEVGMWNSFDDGNEGVCSPNTEEQVALQEALDELENKKLEVWIGVKALKHKNPLDLQFRH